MTEKVRELREMNKQQVINIEIKIEEEFVIIGRKKHKWKDGRWREVEEKIEESGNLKRGVNMQDRIRYKKMIE